MARIEQVANTHRALGLLGTSHRSTYDAYRALLEKDPGNSSTGYVNCEYGYTCITSSCGDQDLTIRPLSMHTIVLLDRHQAGEACEIPTWHRS